MTVAVFVVREAGAEGIALWFDADRVWRHLLRAQVTRRFVVVVGGLVGLRVRIVQIEVVATMIVLVVEAFSRTFHDIFR